MEFKKRNSARNAYTRLSKLQSSNTHYNRQSLQQLWALPKKKLSATRIEQFHLKFNFTTIHLLSCTRTHAHRHCMEKHISEFAWRTVHRQRLVRWSLLYVWWRCNLALKWNDFMIIVCFFFLFVFLFAIFKWFSCGVRCFARFTYFSVWLDLQINVM